MENKAKEKCGVFGVIGKLPTSVDNILNGLSKIQHRGRESFGFCLKSTDLKYKTHTFVDLIKNARSQMTEDFLNLKTDIALGHTRYSTSGEKNTGTENCMPVMFKHKLLKIGECIFAFNGNIPFDKKYLELEELKDHADFLRENYVDTNMIKLFIQNCVNNVNTIKDILVRFISVFPRAYSLAVLNNDTLYILKDRYGLKPLCVGFYDGKETSYCIASESCALLSNYTYFREVNSGEILEISQKSINSIYSYDSDNSKNTNRASCLFEYIYFMNEKSIGYYKNCDENINSIRYKFGEKLAENELLAEKIKDIKDDFVVVGVPSTGISSALGFSNKMNIPSVDGLVKHKNSNRTFILQDDQNRNAAASKKYIVNKNLISGKNIFLIDDSIVRGITLRNIITKLKENGVKQIHLRVSSPKITGICYYGVDIPSKEELIANRLKISEMCEELGVDSLRYLELKDMIAAFPKNVENDFCTGCINGNYNENADRDIEDLF